MREHKFRAWCKKDKLMYWDIQNGITFDDGSRYTFDQFLNPSSDDYHEWVIEEYTGLPDKNGKEICEGDICSIIKVGIVDMDDPNPYRRIIKWNNRKGGFDHFRIDGKEGGSGWSFLQSTVEKYYEVIGDIHQHPELLEA